MPPKKSIAQKPVQALAGSSSRRQMQGATPRSRQSANRPSKSPTPPPEEEEIDVATVIQECLAESAAQIQAQLQARQDKVLIALNQIDASLNQPSRKRNT